MKGQLETALGSPSNLWWSTIAQETRVPWNHGWESKRQVRGNYYRTLKKFWYFRFFSLLIFLLLFIVHFLLSSSSHSLMSCSPKDIYEGMDLRQRRSSSPGYIDSPLYSHRDVSLTMPRSPQHYYMSGMSLPSVSSLREGGSILLFLAALLVITSFNKHVNIRCIKSM